MAGTCCVTIPKLRRKRVGHNRLLGYRRSQPALPGRCTHARFATAAYLDIELKVSGNEEAIACRGARESGRSVVTSSRLSCPRCCFVCTRFDPSMPLGYICKDARGGELGRSCRSRPSSHISPWCRERLSTRSRARHAAVYLDCEPADRSAAVCQWGVDGLISDDPTLLAETFPKALEQAGRAALQRRVTAIVSSCKARFSGRHSAAGVKADSASKERDRRRPRKACSTRDLRFRFAPSRVAHLDLS